MQRDLEWYLNSVRLGQHFTVTRIPSGVLVELESKLDPKFSHLTTREKLHVLVDNVVDLPSCATCAGPTTFSRNGITKRYQFNKFCCVSCKNRYCPVVEMPADELHTKIAALSNEHLRTLALRDPMLYGALVTATPYCVSTAKSNNKQGVTVIQRAWHIKNKTIQVPACIHCKSPTLWDPQTKQYCNFCCTTCATSSWEGRGNIRTLTRAAYTKLTDRDWFYDQHITQRKTFSQMQTELNVAVPYTLSYWAKKHGIRNQRYALSSIHRQLLEWLQGQGYSVLSNCRTIIPPRELDLVIASHSVAIEYGSFYYHSIGNLQHLKRLTPSYHHRKWDECRRVGYTLVTLFDSSDSLEQCKMQILVALNKIDLPENRGNLRYYHSTHASATNILEPKIMKSNQLSDGQNPTGPRIQLDLYDCGTVVYDNE